MAPQAGHDERPSSPGIDDHDFVSAGSDGDLDMFREPDDFRPKTPPPQVLRVPYDFTGHEATTTLLPADETGPADNNELKIHLLGSHPLWGHHLWNASLDISRYLQAHAKTLLAGKSVLELGAAAGVPSIVCAREGAQTVVATDYPDTELIDVLEKNMTINTLAQTGLGASIITEGYLWGSGDTQLKSHLPEGSQSGFDLLLLSDLIFNHQAHEALLSTMSSCLAETKSPSQSLASVDGASPTQSESQLFQHDESNQAFPDELGLGEFTVQEPKTPCVLVFFTHHRPHLAHKDMDFFVKARNTGWEVERVGRWRRSVSFKQCVALRADAELTFVQFHSLQPMFPDDPGSSIVRGTVHGFRLFRTS